MPVDQLGYCYLQGIKCCLDIMPMLFTRDERLHIQLSGLSRLNIVQEQDSDN